MKTATILVVDDERNILTSVSRALALEGYEVEVAGSAEIALEKLSTRRVDAILLDVQLPRMDGLAMIDELRKREIRIPVIMMSGHATIEVAVEATRRGADDFIEKPIGSERLLLSLKHSLEIRELQQENQELRKRYGARESLMGRSPAMTRLREQIDRSDSRRARNRQGAGRNRDSRWLCARLRTVRKAQLCCGSRWSHRKRAIWTRGRGLHRRYESTIRKVRARTRRDPVPR